MTTILIIDDMETHAEYLARCLSKAGHRVLISRDAEEALKVAILEQPDLIACDLNMPRMDGFDFVKAARARHDLKDTPIVAVTGYAWESDRQKALAAGFDGYVSKPLDIDPDLVVAELLEFVK